jgi:hypothetical protein
MPCLFTAVIVVRRFLETFLICYSCRTLNRNRTPKYFPFVSTVLEKESPDNAVACWPIYCVHLLNFGNEVVYGVVVNFIKLYFNTPLLITGG